MLLTTRVSKRIDTDALLRGNQKRLQTQAYVYASLLRGERLLEAVAKVY